MSPRDRRDDGPTLPHLQEAHPAASPIFKRRETSYSRALNSGHIHIGVSVFDTSRTSEINFHSMRW
jgi:hypothetical protein